MLQASIGTEVAGWQGVATRLFALKRPPLKFSIDEPTPLLSPETRREGRKALVCGLSLARLITAKLDILDDAVRMERDAFRERLERFLRQSQFEI